MRSEGLEREGDTARKRWWFRPLTLLVPWLCDAVGVLPGWDGQGFWPLSFDGLGGVATRPGWGVTDL